MKRITKYTALGIILLPLSYVAIAQPTVFDRDNATPKPVTPVWETERDLIVLFENSSDRIALALAIMNISLDINTSLTNQQRFDGLHIAGHTLYREGEPEYSMTCFNGIIALNISDDSVADAARTKAQALVLLGRDDEAMDAYQLCDMLSRQIEVQEGYHDLYRLTILNYLQAAEQSGDHATVFSLVDEILLNPQEYQQDEVDSRIFALEAGARIAKRAGINDQAAAYLTTLLDLFPDYGTAFPGPRVKIQMDLVEAQGFSLANKDPEAVEAAMEIAMDEQYFGMPIWSYYVDTSARILDENDDVQRANKFRLWAVDQLESKLNGLPSGGLNTPAFQRAIRQSQSDLLYRTANMYQKTKQNQLASDMYQRIINDYADVTPEYAQYSSRRLTELQPAP